MKLSNRLTRLFVILLLIGFLTGLSAVPALHAQTVEQQLIWKDYFVAQQFAQFPRDARYDDLMAQTARRLNQVIVKTFGEDKNITFYVCPSRLGFNAVSFHRFIVFDSLLLDSLRFLAIGTVYYGTDDNPYTNRLALAVAQKSRAHQMGYLAWNQMDNENPFGLPKVDGYLNAEQQQKAQELFIQMLVSWMAHEGSHCMRDHIKNRMESALRNNQQMNFDSSQQFNNNVNAYMNAKITQQLEKDADIHATRWLINAGYRPDGFVIWLKFGEKLEKIMGTDNAYLRTHPRCSDRINYIRQESSRLGRPVSLSTSAPVKTPRYNPPTDPDDDDDDDSPHQEPTEPY